MRCVISIPPSDAPMPRHRNRAWARLHTNPSAVFGVGLVAFCVVVALLAPILPIPGPAAFDAAVAMGFVLHVVESHLNGLLGDLPAIILSPKAGSAIRCPGRVSRGWDAAWNCAVWNRGASIVSCRFIEEWARRRK